MWGGYFTPGGWVLNGKWDSQFDEKHGKLQPTRGAWALIAKGGIGNRHGGLLM